MTPKEAVEYAKSIQKKCKSKNELVERTSKKFGVKPGTVWGYFRSLKYRTPRFTKRRGIALKEYWDRIKSRGLKMLVFKPMPKSLEMFELIKAKPRFFSELKELGVKYPDACYITLKRNGYEMRRFNYSHRNRGNTKSKFGAKMLKYSTIFYLPQQNLEVYNMLEETFGSTDFKSKKHSMFHALGIRHYIGSKGKVTKKINLNNKKHIIKQVS